MDFYDNEFSFDIGYLDQAEDEDQNLGEYFVLISFLPLINNIKHFWL